MDKDEMTTTITLTLPLRVAARVLDYAAGLTDPPVVNTINTGADDIPTCLTKPDDSDAPVDRSAPPVLLARFPDPEPISPPAKKQRRGRPTWAHRKKVVRRDGKIAAPYFGGTFASIAKRLFDSVEFGIIDGERAVLLTEKEALMVSATKAADEAKKKKAVKS